MISIIHVPGSNSNNLQHALEYIDEVELIVTPDQMSENTRVIFLPGVGFFHSYMSFLYKHGWVEMLAATNIPIIGICVGFHVMCLSSEESVGDKGLGYFPAFVERIQVKDSKSLSKVPNVGRRTLPKVNFLPPLEEAYFVHSFAVIFKNPTDEFLIQKTDIAGRKYAIAIKKGNRIGLQYHPELSGTEAIPFLSQLIKGEFYG